MAFSSIVEILNRIHPARALKQQTLEKYYFAFRVTVLTFFYKPLVTSVPLPSSLKHNKMDMALSDVSTALKPLFTTYWGSVHPLSCTTTGCGTCLVFDCNFKMRHMYCAFLDEFRQTPLGPIQTGCTRMPLWKKRHCESHGHCQEQATEKTQVQEPVHFTRSKKANDEHVVDCVLERRLVSKSKKRVKISSASIEDFEYKVRWVGYGPQSDTWEPFSSFRSPALIEAKFGFVPSAVISEDDVASDIVAPCVNIRKDKALAKNRASTAVATANWPCGIYVSIDEVQSHSIFACT